MLINYKINFKQNWHFTEYVCYFEIFNTGINVDKTRKIYPYLFVTGSDLYLLKLGKRDHLFFKLKCLLQLFGKQIK